MALSPRNLYNLIERNNKGLKHTAKVKEQFPNEDSLDRYACCYYSDTNRKYADRAQRGFLKASAELLQMFDPDPQVPDDQSKSEAA